MGATGEGLVTTFPGGLYAAAWGTSFSSALVAGTVALLHDANGGDADPGRLLPGGTGLTGRRSTSSRSSSARAALDIDHA